MLGVVTMAAVGALLLAAPWSDDAVSLYDSQRSVRELSLPTAGDGGAALAPAGSDPAAPLAVGGPTPAAAVRAYLEAESRRDFERSFALLSESDRAELESVARWESAHRESGTLISFEMAARPVVRGDEATAAVVLALRPELSDVVGLVPAAARVEYRLRREAGAWFVVATPSRFDSMYREDGAERAVAAWIAARQACRTDGAGSYDGTLLGHGAAVLEESLCTPADETREPAQVGSAATVARDSQIAADLVTAFGGEALRWARVVGVSGPADLDVVAAPVGSEWIVIGLQQHSTAVSG